jgi:hypothetical protein
LKLIKGLFKKKGRKETPVCLPLPGGFTNFCGRIYGISKKNEEFKACLGLELRADEEVEAALRVSCFSFGPRGLKVMEAEPIPVAAAVEEEDGIYCFYRETFQCHNFIILFLFR